MDAAGLLPMAQSCANQHPPTASLTEYSLRAHITFLTVIFEGPYLPNATTLQGFTDLIQTTSASWMRHTAHFTATPPHPARRYIREQALLDAHRTLGQLLQLINGCFRSSPTTLQDSILHARWCLLYVYAHSSRRAVLAKYRHIMTSPFRPRPPSIADALSPAGYIYLLVRIKPGRRAYWYIG